jgi:hypothetical protein
MRATALIALTMLVGCAINPPPPPGRYPDSTSARRPQSGVDEWTRQQRECETGEKDKQRRCIMPPPEN